MPTCALEHLGQMALDTFHGAVPAQDAAPLGLSNGC